MRGSKARKIEEGGRRVKRDRRETDRLIERGRTVAGAGEDSRTGGLVVRTNRGCRVRPQARRRRRKPGTAPGAEGPGERGKTAHAASWGPARVCSRCDECNALSTARENGLQRDSVGWWPAVHSSERKRETRRYARQGGTRGATGMRRKREGCVKEEG